MSWLLCSNGNLCVCSSDGCKSVGAGPTDVPGHHDEDRLAATRGNDPIFEEVRAMLTASVGWLVGWLVGWMVCWFVCWLVCWLLSCLLCGVVACF